MPYPLSRSVDAELSTSLAVLDTLAGSGCLAANDISGFARTAEALLERRPQWATIVLSTADGKVLLDARSEAVKSVPATAADADARIAHIGRERISDLHYQEAFKAHVFSVRVPVQRNDARTHMLAGVIRPDSIQELLAKQHIPEGGVVAIADRNFKVVARSLNQHDWLGKSVSPSFMALVRKGGQGGWDITNTLEGRSVYSVYQTSSITGWTAAVGIPTEVLDSPVTKSYLVLGGAIVLSALIGLVVALITGRSITQPMQALERAAEAIGRGEAPAIPDTRLPEVRNIATALAAGHAEREMLLQREREARVLAEASSAKLSEADRRKDEFLATLAHELRNPLAPISSALQILRLKGSSDPHIGHARDVIDRQVKHMTHLVDDLLDVARITRGSIQLRLQPLELASAINGALETARPIVETNQQHLKIKLQPTPIYVEADATRLAQVLSNLLTNASKYTPKDGHIVLNVDHQNSEAIITVRDDGIGIDEEHLETIFEMFSQVTPPLDRTQGGLGIGLALVKGLIELHGGSVAVRSDGPGRGSTFEIRLPTIDGAAYRAQSHEPDFAGRQFRILVVDDNVDGAESLALMLRLSGHKVDVSHDGADAVAKANALQPDLILLDVGLPRLNGYEVASRIRSQAWSNGSVIVAVTGWGQEEDKQRARNAGFHHHLTKPLDFAALERIFAELNNRPA